MFRQNLSSSVGFAAKGLWSCSPLICLVFAAAPVCFGGLATCLNTSATSIADNNRQTAGVAIAAEGAGDDFATLDSTTPAGCAGTDIQFLNLTINAAASAASGTYMSTLANQSLALGPVDAIFSTVRGLDNGANKGNDDGTNAWTDNAGGAPPTRITTSYEVDSTVTMYSFGLNLLGARPGTGGGTITGEFDLCLGAAFVGGFGGTCSGTEETFSLAPGVYAYNEVLTGGFTTIGVANNFILTGTGSGAGITYLTSFEESFDSPEPSTFLLFGMALAGIAAFRFYKRKQQS
jgi:PEP-CTERM motif